VKDFFHIGPPFTFFTGVEGLLAGLGEGPPFLSLGIGSYLGAVGLEVVTNVFEVTEKVVFSVGELAEEDGEILNIAFLDPVEYFRPDVGVETLVFVHLFFSESNDLSVALHRVILLL